MFTKSNGNINLIPTHNPRMKKYYLLNWCFITINIDPTFESTQIAFEWNIMYLLKLSFVNFLLLHGNIYLPDNEKWENEYVFWYSPEAVFVVRFSLKWNGTNEQCYEIISITFINVMKSTKRTKKVEIQFDCIQIQKYLNKSRYTNICIGVSIFK